MTADILQTLLVIYLVGCFAAICCNTLNYIIKYQTFKKMDCIEKLSAFIITNIVTGILSWFGAFVALVSIYNYISKDKETNTIKE